LEPEPRAGPAGAAPPSAPGGPPAGGAGAEGGVKNWSNENPPGGGGAVPGAGSSGGGALASVATALCGLSSPNTASSVMLSSAGATISGTGSSSGGAMANAPSSSEPEDSGRGKGAGSGDATGRPAGGRPARILRKKVGTDSPVSAPLARESPDARPATRARSRWSPGRWASNA